MQWGEATFSLHFSLHFPIFPFLLTKPRSYREMSCEKQFNQHNNLAFMWDFSNSLKYHELFKAAMKLTKLNHSLHESTVSVQNNSLTQNVQKPLEFSVENCFLFRGRYDCFHFSLMQQVVSIDKCEKSCSSVIRRGWGNCAGNLPAIPLHNHRPGIFSLQVFFSLSLLLAGSWNRLRLVTEGKIGSLTIRKIPSKSVQGGPFRCLE